MNENETNKKIKKFSKNLADFKGDKLIDLLTQSGLVESEKHEDYVTNNEGEFPALKLTRKLRIKAKLYKTILNNILCRPFDEVQQIIDSPTCPTVHQLLFDIVRRAGVNKECRDFVLYASMNQDSESITMELERNKQYVGAIEKTSNSGDIKDVGPSSQRRIFHLVPKNDVSPEAVEERQLELKRNSLDQVNALLEKNGLKTVDLSDLSKASEKQAQAISDTQKS